MAASDQQRIKDLERQLNALRREVATMLSRVATPSHIRLGWWLAVLEGAMSQGGTATAEIIVWSIPDAEWQRTGETITVRDFFLNLTGTIPTGTKIRADWYRNVWALTNWYCAASDTLPDEVLGSEAGDELTTEDGITLEVE